MKRTVSHALAGALALTLTAPSVALAHAEHDGQSAWLTVGRDGVAVELSLTPGTRVAAAFLRLVDTDGDHALSEAEQQSFGARVAQDLSLVVDGRPSALRVERSTLPDARVVSSGESTASVLLTAPVTLAAGSHRLCFTNRHAALPSAWAANIFSGDRSITLAALSRSDEGRSLCATVTRPWAPVAPADVTHRGSGGLLAFGLAAALGALASRGRG